MEGALLGIFMFAAVSVTALLEHPGSWIHQIGADAPIVRRACIGVAMGLTAVMLIYSPWGRKSGAHMNPTVTLTFMLLGKATPRQTVGYVLAQFMGGYLGVLSAYLVMGSVAAHQSVTFAATRPGIYGPAAAFVAETAISGLLMLVVLATTSNPKTAPYTGLIAGTLVACYITLEAPLSGMSMNPARTTASALASGIWTHAWIYFIAPPIGMLSAAALHVALKGRQCVPCARLMHDNSMPCIFCGHPGNSGTSPRFPQK